MPRPYAKPPRVPRRRVVSVVTALEVWVEVFIIAMVFRGFAAEAFVVPTGSMAPNLNGLHRTQTCSACGTEYHYGFSGPLTGPWRPPGGLICPNCGFAGDKPVLTDPGRGDQIFVLEWMFDVGRMLPDIDPHGPRRWWHVFKPRRWDVVVFKDPHDGETNYIKRLIGLPGEVLEIIDGDVYTAKAEDLAETEAGRSVLDKLERRHAVYDQLGPAERHTYDGALKIQRKTDKAQGVLWLPVYNHDFPPVRKPSLAGWRPVDENSRWQTNDRAFRFDPADDGGLEQIAFVRGESARFEPALPASGHPVTDGYAYNGSLRPMGDGYPIDVSDLRLRCVLTPLAGHGRFALSLSKRDDRFVATFSSAGNVQLARASVSRPHEPPQVVGQARIDPLRPDRPLALSLSNVDYRVTVEVDGRPVVRTTDDQYPALRDGGPGCLATYARALALADGDAVPQIRIGADGMPLVLAHVVIERDVYYRSPRHGNRPIGRGVQGRPIYLRSRRDRGIEEYFCLGDNSPLSKDGRLWEDVGPHLTHRLATGNYQLGTVAGDQMMGRGFCVLWPAAFSLFHGRLPVIPNVEEMRMIR